jgi:hypothetical protein
MNKLRDKINALVPIEFGGMQEPLLSELEQITDDFAVKFLEWLNENSIYSPKDKEYFFNNEWYSQEEIFKHFKNNIYDN